MIARIQEGPTLFDGRGGLSMEEFFREWHAKNPHVLEAIVGCARELKEAGMKTCGIDLIFCRLRWIEAMRTRGDTFKLNDHWRAYYARLVMHRHEDLSGFFRLRGQVKQFDPSTVSP